VLLLFLVQKQTDKQRTLVGIRNKQTSKQVKIMAPVLLGSLSQWGSTVALKVWEGQQFPMQGKDVTPRSSGGDLLLMISSDDDDGYEQHRRTRADVMEEEKALRIQKIIVEANIVVAQKSIEGGEQKALDKLGKLLVSRGICNTRLHEIAEMKKAKKIKFVFTETIRRESLVLRANLGTDVSALFPELLLPVVWLPTNNTVRVDNIELEKETSGPPDELQVVAAVQPDSDTNKFIRPPPPNSIMSYSYDGRKIQMGHPGGTDANTLGAPSSRYTVQLGKIGNYNRYMIGWAPPTLRGTTRQYNKCGFYLHPSSMGIGFYSQPGEHKTLHHCGKKWKKEDAHRITSVYDNQARTISFKLWKTEEMVVVFSGVPMGLQPAFCLGYQGECVEFVDELWW